MSRTISAMTVGRSVTIGFLIELPRPHHSPGLRLNQPALPVEVKYEKFTSMFAAESLDDIPVRSVVGQRLDDPIGYSVGERHTSSHQINDIITYTCEISDALSPWAARSSWAHDFNGVPGLLNIAQAKRQPEGLMGKAWSS